MYADAIRMGQGGVGGGKRVFIESSDSPCVADTSFSHTYYTRHEYHQRREHMVMINITYAGN